MGKVTKGVFPVHTNDFEVLISEEPYAAGRLSSTPGLTDTWAKVAEIEEVTLTIENNTETWTPFGSDGWESALVTGKSSKFELKGKRCIGDAGNDYIADKLMANGQDAYVSARVLRADGTTLTWDKMACGVTNDGTGGKSTDVGGLEATLTGHGKPVKGTVEETLTAE